MNFHQTCQCFGQVPFIRAFVCAVLLVVANLRKMEPDPVVLTTAPTIIPLGNTKGGTLTVSTFNFHFLLFWGVFCFVFRRCKWERDHFQHKIEKDDSRCKLRWHQNQQNQKLADFDWKKWVTCSYMKEEERNQSYRTFVQRKNAWIKLESGFKER